MRKKLFALLALPVAILAGKRILDKLAGEPVMEMEREAAPRPQDDAPLGGAVSPDLLEILVCPLCKAPVRLKPDQSGLKCEKCHRVYPIKDDIPVMLVDEATIESP
jgi:uncharacterized protein YbaR (Trm112 family)